MSVELHTHRLTECTECDGGEKGPCDWCHGRGYYEFCVICGQPMGNRGRKLKRQRRALDGRHPSE